MTKPKTTRCAIYTRKSTEEGLEQDFNSLDAQREASEAYIKSQWHEGWQLIPTQYDDAAYSGGNMDRPALRRLLRDIEAGLVDIVIVYKVDRLSRALGDFAKMVEIFDAHNVSFVSVTQAFNTTTSMGRLTLNVLLSFAQFEREVTSERIRDKVAASKKKGMWMGGPQPLGYDAVDRKLVINDKEAEIIRFIYQYYANKSKDEPLYALLERLNSKGFRNKSYTSKRGNNIVGKAFTLGQLYKILQNPLYNGRITHKNVIYEGEHDAIIENELWQEVQTKIAKTDLKRNASKAHEKPKLYGKLFDYLGNRMSPTYSYKYTNAGRYKMRYYVNCELAKTGKTLSEFKRVRAELIDDTVLAETKQIVETLVNAASSSTLLASPLLAQLTANRCRPEKLVQKVTLFPKHLEITLQLNALTDSIAPLIKEHLSAYEPTITHQTIQVHVAAHYRRSNGQLHILTANGVADSIHTEATYRYPSDKTFTMLAKGQYWQRQLSSGDHPTLQKIARLDHHSVEYVKKAVKLCYLSPRIMNRICSNNTQSQLALESLTQCHHWNWGEQEALLLANTSS